MNTRSILFVGLSLAFGAGAVFMAQRWLNQNQLEFSPDSDSVPVVAMAVSVSAGTILQDKHVTVTSVPVALAPSNVITDPADAVGKVTKYPVMEGDTLHPQKLALKGEGSVLASLIEPNMRAVSIRVNDVVGVAGFLLPGNRVDVLVTLKNRKRNDMDWSSGTEVILSNLKVLAIDQKANQDSNQPVVVRAVTLEVTLEQAEILMSARSKGEIQLALRNPNDAGEIQVASSQIEEKSTLSVTAEPIPQPNKAAPVRTTPRKRVELIKGTAKETVTVGKDATTELDKKDS
ncbi:Flp pilus assembly protein CpaB [Ferrimonas pelagia]|uniref:Flp pilus assembly protein CpaB n=1 Tax=Ferrimonas pelagia TaxID=1177826 RepID=A0ABP9ES05_9GAMM